MITTIGDLYHEYQDRCGSHAPLRTWDEVRDEFHRRGFTNYEKEGEHFLQEIFNDGWAWGNNRGKK